MNQNPELNKSFSAARIWRQEAQGPREILLKAGLKEELKWGKPCYTHDGKNICIIQQMNDFLALMFFKGALLKDPDGVLEVQGPNSRAGYRIRFTSVEDVTRREMNIIACIREEIKVENAGLKIEKAPAKGFMNKLLLNFHLSCLL